MDRLTIPLETSNSGFRYMPGEWAELIKPLFIKKRVINRLGAYEDTGLTPEQIREIDKLYAEQAKELMRYRQVGQQGSLLRLPILIGNTVIYSRNGNPNMLTCGDNKQAKIILKEMGSQMN